MDQGARPVASGPRGTAGHASAPGGATGYLGHVLSASWRLMVVAALAWTPVVLVPLAHADVPPECSQGVDVSKPSKVAVSDEFVGQNKKAPDTSLWGYDTGGGWPNEEQQVYTRSVNNASTDGKGHLAITALKTAVGYSSARLKTQNKLTMGYGRVEASIQMPPGPGVLPAFWLLGSDYPQVGWANCGEIDVIEYVLGQCHFTLHGPQDGEPDYRPEGQPPYSGVSRDWSPPFDPSKGFHTYWAERHPGQITIGVDDAVSYVFTPDTLPAAAHWVFDDRPMFAILNVAVGGGWAGDPDPADFPQRMLVDWFRFTPASS